MSVLLTAYLGAHASLAIAWLAFHGWLRLIEAAPALRGAVRWRARVTVGRALFIIAALAWPLAGALPRHHVLPDATKLWLKAESRADAQAALPATTAAPGAHKAAGAGADARDAWAVVLALGVALEFLLAAKGARAVARVVRRAVPFRHVGRLTLLAQSDVPVPFALRLPGRALVVLPTALLARPADLRVALRHEGQHHRHHDTAWALGLAGASLLFPLNPFVRLWRRTFQDLHEVACDEALVGHRRLDPRAYGRCLVDVAEAALGCRSFLPGTAGMSQSKPRLERRLALFYRHERALAPRAPRPLMLALTLIVGIGAGVLSLAYAAQGARPHGPLTMAEGRDLVAHLPTTPEFPIVMNDHVLARINRIITDPGRSLSLKESLQRMEAHRDFIEKRLAASHFPRELLAVPLVESGYQNLGPMAAVKVPKGVVQGAGLWMFIKGTARKYGLKVSDTVDERLDVERETEAAIRLLGDNRLKYDDWLLSLAAYNQGGGAVDEAIVRGGTHDAWTLVGKGHLNDYVVYVTAGVILMGRPELLE